MENFTIKKTTVECYKIRHPKKDYWADITIDTDGGKQGRVQIASDFGAWQYFWGAAGPSFKQFLISLNIDYVASKFGADGWFDLDKTVAGFKEVINECGFSDDDRAKALEEVKMLYDNSSCKEECVQLLVNDCPKIMEVYDGMPDIATNINPSFRRFWNELWPVFVNELKNESLVDA
jgi:hypothetical protein